MNCARITQLSKPHDSRETLEKEVLVGMTDSPKWFPSKYLYDEEGFALFDQISREPQYYVYRTEIDILREHAREVMESVRPGEMVELGSGTSTKTKVLLEAMFSTGCRRYVPLEISEQILRRAVGELTADYPWLTVDGYVGDFDTDLPKLRRVGRRLLVFLGTTIGNYRNRAERGKFLSKISAALSAGDALLIGLDLVKPASDIAAGYADSKGLKKQLALRSIRIMNQRLGANFVEENFQYRRVWNAESSSLEGWLVAVEEARVFIERLQLEVGFCQGEGFQTWLSTKFTREGITEELEGVGLGVTAWFTDSQERFAVLLATPKSGK